MPAGSAQPPAIDMQTLDVVRTRAETFGFDVIVDDAAALDHPSVFGVLLQRWHHGRNSRLQRADYWAEIP